MDFPVGQMLLHSDLRHDEELACDAVVMGSGAGGAAVAWVLSKLGAKVAILEEGRPFEPEQLSKRPSWAYRNLYAERGTRVMTGNLYIPLPAGRAVGGSTLLNSAICFRTPDDVLKLWREHHGIPWASAKVLAPIFDELETLLGVAPTDPTQARKNNLIFKKGAEALGIRGDFIRRNAPGCVGCGICQLGCPIGGKGSVDRNLIPAALEQGAALFTSARAGRLLVERGAAVGIEAQVVEPMSERAVRRLTVNAKKVFLCGSAIGTPLFLLRQGLANSSGQVGRNLHVHPACGACARFDEIIDAWDGVTQGYYVPLSGSMLETFSLTQDLYYSQYPELAAPLENLRRLASCGCMIGDDSSGEVTLGPTDGRASIRYELNELDKRRLVFGLREIGRIFFAAGALEFHPGIRGVGTARDSKRVDELCREDVPVGQLQAYASHPMGTCRMSADRREGVVAPTGEAWDLKNLFIADGSVLPTSLGVNPQMTILATAVTIARQAAKTG